MVDEEEKTEAMLYIIGRSIYVAQLELWASFDARRFRRELQTGEKTDPRHLSRRNLRILDLLPKNI
jgi:hypothetical protein